MAKLNGGKNGLDSRFRLGSSGEDLFRSNTSLSRKANDGEESPALADLSSNDTPELGPKSKKNPVRKPGKERKHSRSGRRSATTPEGDPADQSAFPVRTPDKDGFLGPLSDLLEEEITLPGESRHSSAEGPGAGNRSWAYLPSNRKSPTSSTTSSSVTSLSETIGGDMELQEHRAIVSSPPSAHSWQQRKKQREKRSPRPSKYSPSTGGARRKSSSSGGPGTREEEIQVVEGQGEGALALGAVPSATSTPIMEPDMSKFLDDVEDELDEDESKKKRALSAKSHIFRKTKVESMVKP